MNPGRWVKLYARIRIVEHNRRMDSLFTTGCKKPGITYWGRRVRITYGSLTVQWRKVRIIFAPVSNVTFRWLTDSQWTQWTRPHLQHFRSLQFFGSVRHYGDISCHEGETAEVKGQLNPSLLSWIAFRDINAAAAAPLYPAPPYPPLLLLCKRWQFHINGGSSSPKWGRARSEDEKWRTRLRRGELVSLEMI